MKHLFTIVYQAVLTQLPAQLLGAALTACAPWAGRAAYHGVTARRTHRSPMAVAGGDHSKPQ